MKQIKYKEWDCYVDITKSYGNGQKAILLHEVGTGELIAKATVCLGTEMPHNVTLVKDYSENVGMLKALVDNGVVEPTGVIYPAGFREVHEVTIL